MLIYHTCASMNDLQKAREIAPSHEHGFGWIPEKMSAHDAPYFIDNGAYRAWKNDTEWESEKFLMRLDQVETRMPREPDFVVLPDVMESGLVSVARSGKWADRIAEYGYDYYMPVQDGMEPEGAVEAALELDASGVFIGGSRAFKMQHASTFCDLAHDHGLIAHIGKPGRRLSWARDVGADSVDTASVSRNDYWDRLRKLEGTPRTQVASLSSFG